MIRLLAIVFVALSVPIDNSVMAQNADEGFHTPSKNIWCIYDPRGTQALECDVVQRAWKDWAQWNGGSMGQRFQIQQTGLARAINSSDTMMRTN